MLNIIIKDIIIQKTMIPFTLLYIVVFILSTSGSFNKGSVYIVGVTVAFIFSLGSMQYDEKYKADNIIASLPVKRIDIIISRYLGTIFFTAVSIFFIMIFAGFVNLINISSKIPSININDIKIIVTTALVMMSLIIPSYLKFGINKGKFIIFISYFTFFSLGMTIYDNTNGGLMNTIYLFLVNNGLILATLLFVVSFVCSILIYDNKDFA